MLPPPACLTYFKITMPFLCVCACAHACECVCVHTRVHVCVYVLACEVCMRRSEDDPGYLSLGTSHLLFETGSLSGLHHHVGQASWPAGSQGPPVSTSYLTVFDLTGAHCHAWLLRWALGIPPRSSWLQDRCFTNRAISRALNCLSAVWLCFCLVWKQLH